MKACGSKIYPTRMYGSGENGLKRDKNKTLTFCFAAAAVGWLRFFRAFFLIVSVGRALLAAPPLLPSPPLLEVEEGTVAVPEDEDDVHKSNMLFSREDCQVEWSSSGIDKWKHCQKPAQQQLWSTQPARKMDMTQHTKTTSWVDQHFHLQRKKIKVILPAANVMIILRT